MEYRTTGKGAATSNKIWNNAVNTLLSAMESILLDEDLQSLWPREHHQAFKKKHSVPTTPPISSHHDPTFSPPLKRKTDPSPPSDRSTKSQRMTDHLTARLATSLHVSSSADDQVDTQQNGSLNLRGFHRIQDPSSLPKTFQENSLPEPRKYRKAIRNRSNPSTPANSHPPSPGTPSVADADDLFSSSHSSLNASLHSIPASGSMFESFAMNTVSPSVSMGFAKHSRPSSLLMRRENRINQQPIRSPAHHHLPIATRLAVFHRVVSTTKSPTAQSIDKDVWISQQVSKRGFGDHLSFEAAMNSHIHNLVTALASLRNGFSQSQGSFSFTQRRDQRQEYAVYCSMKTAVDTVLESAHWLCAPDFDMGINRICPDWPVYEGSMEHMVHYVQVVESMWKMISDQPQHPHDLSEDLKRSQETIDYQRTILGDTLCNNGLAWRALGLPPMEELIQSTQDWILNLAKVLTIKIRGEVNLALERSAHSFSTADPADVDMMDDGGESMSGRQLDEVMSLVLQGALLSRSCLELAGKKCPMLVTAWIELTSRYCTYALTRRKECVLKASKALPNQSRKFMPSSMSGIDSSRQHRHHHHQHPGLSRGVILKSMEIFENVGRLLQCLMEMHEEEEERGDQELGILDDGLGAGSECEDSGQPQGTSSTSSDQDDAMDFAPATSQQHLYQAQRSPRTAPQYHRRMPVDPMVLQRLMAMESLASVLVEIGLELCESMAEILGCRYQSDSKPWSTATASFDGFAESNFLPSTLMTRKAPSLVDRPPSTTSTAMSSSARAAAAISSLTSFAGGGVMASGTGGVGFIYVQFAVRLVTKFIEFASHDTRQEQRLASSRKFAEP
ncbi:hypothetical protein BGX34_009820 [Mortierella sp. NVP85]|nr:hypothetical protein BGX34_009820 [Mortierella sp. NVP85]